MLRLLRVIAHGLRDRLREHRRIHQPKPHIPRKVAFIELSNICNARCVFCSYPTIAKSGKPLLHMEEQTFFHSLELSLSLGYQRLAFTPTTGEVLANPRWDYYLRIALNDKRVRTVYFYSNAILLSNENIRKIISLPQLAKFDGLYFSVGGTDQETYSAMFGVDKFKVVSRNINALCAQLKASDMTLPIYCEARVNKSNKVTEEEMERTFNTAHYAHFRPSILRAYDPLGGLISHPDLAYLPQIRDKTLPCYRLYDLRFDALGRLWMCGCVVSEIPNDESLLIGRLPTDAKTVISAQSKIIEKWIKGDLPKVCSTCRVYKPASIKNQ